MKHFKPFLSHALSLLMLVLSATMAWAQQAHPNILFVLSDDQSARFVGCYGDTAIKTPNLDRFAQEGMRFDRAYVTSPQCVPSRATLMTGRSAVDIGMTRFSAPLPRDIVSFPELLRSSSGYYTGILGRSYHLDGAAQAPESKRVFDEHNLRTFRDRVDHLSTDPIGKVPEVMQSFLDSVPQGKPWFLQVNFYDPHRPFDTNAIAQPHDPNKLKLPLFFPDTPLVRQDLARYDDEVSRMDSDFARVLQILDQRGLSKNTLVIFMGDNGAALLRGKGTLYELGVRVPIIARWPGVIKPGSSAPMLVSGEDIAPTFLNAGGAPVPASMTGKSLLPVLRGEAATPHPYVFAERGAHATGLPVNTGAFDLGRVIISPTHKLIYNALWQLPYTPVDFSGQPLWRDLREKNDAGQLSPVFSRLYFPPARPMFELYDLRADPEEMNNLAGQPTSAAIERELKGGLQEWMILNHDFLPLPVPPSKGGGD